MHLSKSIQRLIKFDENKTVDIDYEVDPGEKVYIRNVQISGNDRTVDRVVRRELYLTEGNLYSRTDLQDSKDALKRTSYFDDVEIEEDPVDKKYSRSKSKSKRGLNWLDKRWYRIRK